MRTEVSTDIIDQWKIIGPVMTALGSITRQRIIMLFEPGEQLNIKRIADQFNLSRTAVVHHIGVLQDAGILKGERVGKEVVMFVDWDLIALTMDRIKSYIAAFGSMKAARQG